MYFFALVALVSCYLSCCCGMAYTSFPERNKKPPILFFCELFNFETKYNEQNMVIFVSGDSGMYVGVLILAIYKMNMMR